MIKSIELRHQFHRQNGKHGFTLLIIEEVTNEVLAEQSGCWIRIMCSKSMANFLPYAEAEEQE